MSKIAFFGTPDFAATIFKGLLTYCKQNGHTTQFAVCQPDRPKGRSQTLEPPRVKTIALENQIEVLQPLTLKAGTPDGDAFYERLSMAQLDLAIVVAYGRIIPKRMLVLPKRGFVNVHASLLPRWRGASPIQRAIAAGDVQTGVSIMDLVPEMDAGDVYQMRALPILKQDNAATLTEKLSQVGLDTLLESLEGILRGELPKIPQSQEGITFAPKLTKEDGQIPWEKSAQEIIDHSRAMDPWPQSYTHLKGRTVKLFGAHAALTKTLDEDVSPGTIISLDNALTVRCANEEVAFAEIQFEGKRRMSIRDVINGNLLRQGEQFSTE